MVSSNSNPRSSKNSKIIDILSFNHGGKRLLSTSNYQIKVIEAEAEAPHTADTTAETNKTEIEQAETIAAQTEETKIIIKNRNMSNRIWTSSWFPVSPASECLAISVKSNPLILINTNHIKLPTVHTYKTLDQYHEISAPLCVSWNLTGSFIYCGFMKGAIQIFAAEHSTPCYSFSASPSRKSKDGLKGPLSSLDFNPDHSGIFGLASFAGEIGIFDERTNYLISLLSSRTPSSSTPWHKSIGKSQIKFSKCGNFLFSRNRGVDGIECWDLRNTQEILYTLDNPGDPVESSAIPFDAGLMSLGSTTGITPEFNIDSQSADFALSSDDGNSYKADTLSEVESKTGHQGTMQRRFFDINSSGLLGAGFGDGWIGVWDTTKLESGKPVFKWRARSMGGGAVGPCCLNDDKVYCGVGEIDSKCDEKYFGLQFLEFLEK